MLPLNLNFRVRILNQNMQQKTETIVHKIDQISVDDLDEYTEERRKIAETIRVRESFKREREREERAK